LIAVEQRIELPDQGDIHASLSGGRERLDQIVVGSCMRMEKPMTTFKMLSAGVIAAAALVTPALAQEATQEPGVMGFNYPDTRYVTGGYGHRFSPGPGFYYRRHYSGLPVGVATVPPPIVTTVVPADAYAYYGEPGGGVAVWQER
jgi:hypothetical protein